MAKQIVLDTGVARTLCFEEPEWVASFVKMKDKGWTFHLSDVAVAELIAAVERDSITNAQWNNLICRLRKFISNWLSCLPGKKQLFHYFGFTDKELTNEEKDS